MEDWVVGIVIGIILLGTLILVLFAIQNQTAILTWCKAGGYTDHIWHEERTLCIGIDQEGHATAEWLDDVKARLEIAH